MAEKRYLIQRKRTWYVRRRLPADVQHLLGREIVRTTGTRNLDEARRRRYAILAQIESEIDEARKKPDSPGSPAWVVSRAKAMLRDARQDEESAAMVDEIGFWVLIDELIRLRSLKLDEDGHPVIPDGATAEAVSSAAVLLGAGGDAALLSEVIDAYLTETEAHVTTQTYNAKKRRLETFQVWVKDQPIEYIARRHAGRYVEHLMGQGIAPKTVRDTISDLGTFFKWACARGCYGVEYNVFERMGSTVRESTRGGARLTRRAWRHDELFALLSSLDRTNEIQNRLFSLAALGAYTGARLSELCETELKDVHDDYIHIPEGKTESSVRDVPLHPTLRPLVRALVQRAQNIEGNTYLIPGLRPGGEDRKRSHYASKDFGRIKRRLGVCDLSEVNGRQRDRIDFHALRKTFNTALADAGVPTPVREAIVGHSPTGGVNEAVYLDRAKLPELAEAVRKVSYGAAVDALVKRG